MMHLLRAAGTTLLLLGLAACAPVPSADGPRFRALNEQPGDKVRIEDAGDAVTFDITSERGIGRIEIERLGSAPQTVKFHLRIKGLEEYRLTWGEQTVTGHYSSTGGQSDPTVRIESENPKLPLQDGYFVLTAPPAFIQDAPRRFTLQWIDFYR